MLPAQKKKSEMMKPTTTQMLKDEGTRKRKISNDKSKTNTVPPEKSSVTKGTTEQAMANYNEYIKHIYYM
jgi:hypothetical protein